MEEFSRAQGCTILSQAALLTDDDIMADDVQIMRPKRHLDISSTPYSRYSPPPPTPRPTKQSRVGGGGGGSGGSKPNGSRKAPKAVGSPEVPPPALPPLTALDLIKQMRMQVRNPNEKFRGMLTLQCRAPQMRPAQNTSPCVYKDNALTQTLAPQAKIDLFDSPPPASLPGYYDAESDGGNTR
jgi:hypothetical protein